MDEKFTKPMGEAVAYSLSAEKQFFLKKKKW